MSYLHHTCFFVIQESGVSLFSILTIVTTSGSWDAIRLEPAKPGCHPTTAEKVLYTATMKSLVNTAENQKPNHKSIKSPISLQSSQTAINNSNYNINNTCNSANKNSKLLFVCLSVFLFLFCFVAVFKIKFHSTMGHHANHWPSCHKNLTWRKSVWN